MFGQATVEIVSPLGPLSLALVLNWYNTDDAVERPDSSNTGSAGDPLGFPSRR